MPVYVVPQRMPATVFSADGVFWIGWALGDGHGYLGYVTPLLSTYPMKLLLQLLAILRAMHWAHWTAHWRMRGTPFYGDHLMFQRMYEELAGEVDSLAEKIIGTYGGNSVKDEHVISDAHRFITACETAVRDGDLYKRALMMETYLQNAIKTTYDALKASGELSLGMDDFLMALSNAHETNLYLLRQRSQPGGAAMLQNVVARSLKG